MYSGHGREWNWPGTPLITSTLKCRMCIPSCLRLYLLRFSLAQCSHCFPLSSNVCRNKQLPDLGKSRTSHWPYAHLQIYLISRREARSLLCCLKKTMRIKRDNECENVWKLYSVTQIEPLLRENRENRTPSEQALFSWSAVQVRQVHQSLRWQESVPASLKAKFLVVQLGGVSIILLSSQETEAHLGYLSSQADCCEDVLRSEGDRKPWKQQHSQVSPGRTPSPSPRQRSWAVPDSLEPRATPSHVPGRCQLLPVPAFCFSSSSSGHFCSCG